jgi:hypothetical protein
MEEKAFTTQRYPEASELEIVGERIVKCPIIHRHLLR